MKLKDQGFFGQKQQWAHLQQAHLSTYQPVNLSTYQLIEQNPDFSYKFAVLKYTTHNPLWL